MKTKSSFTIIFIVSFLAGQEEIIHISKTHQDGTPKEVIIYEIVNDDLQSNNPFEIVNTISYDIKGNWIRPKFGQLDKLIVGTWLFENDEDKYMKFKRDGTFELYNKGLLRDNGNWYIRIEKSINNIFLFD